MKNETKSLLEHASRVFAESQDSILDRAVSREVGRMVYEYDQKRKQSTIYLVMPIIPDSVCMKVYAMKDNEGAPTNDD